MASCAFCNTTILFGGVKDDELRFCNQKCYEQGRHARRAIRLPDRKVAPILRKVHRGPCPVCDGKGPIDVHVSHTVISLVVVTTWNSKPRVSCRSCGRREQLTGLIMSSMLGWWGFPYGLVMTPIQICKNLSGMIGGPKPDEPSAELERIVRLMIVSGDISADDTYDDDGDDEFIDDAFEEEDDGDYDDVEVVTPAPSKRLATTAAAAPARTFSEAEGSSTEKRVRPAVPKSEPQVASKPAAAKSAAEDRVTCPSCEASFKASASIRGKRVKCPKCSGVIDVPE